MLVKGPNKSTPQYVNCGNSLNPETRTSDFIYSHTSTRMTCFVMTPSDNFEIWLSFGNIIECLHSLLMLDFFNPLLTCIILFHPDKGLSCWFCYWFKQFLRFSALIGLVLHWSIFIAPSSQHISLLLENSSTSSKLKLLSEKSRLKKKHCVYIKGIFLLKNKMNSSLKWLILF